MGVKRMLMSGLPNLFVRDVIHVLAVVRAG
jgi:hypothetical protein